MENCWDYFEEELLAKIHLDLGRQCLCVSLHNCTHMWQRGVWLCFRWEEREKSIKSEEFRQAV